MKAATPIGIGAAIAGLALGALLEGSSPAALINLSAALIVFAGTFGATLAASGMEAIKRVPALYKKAFGTEAPDLRGRIALIIELAEKARREGLLALDDGVAEIEDDFTRKGLQLVVDGTDPALVREVLENEIDGMSARHHASASVFERAGGFAPTMGIIGTVLGLIHVLENLDAPETLGPAISSAFIATLFGVASANIVFLPVANRLKALSEQEAELRLMTLEGILALQAGENPRIIGEKLKSFVPPEEREGAASGGAQRTGPTPVPDSVPEAA
jgi:chemotaxis protein MotA